MDNILDLSDELWRGSEKYRVLFAYIEICFVRFGR